MSTTPTHLSPELADRAGRVDVLLFASIVEAQKAAERAYFVELRRPRTGSVSAATSYANGVAEGLAIALAILSAGSNVEIRADVAGRLELEAGENVDHVERARRVLAGYPVFDALRRGHELEVDEPAFDGMTSLGDRSPAGEELASSEDVDVCPSCGLPLSGPAAIDLLDRVLVCELPEEHETEVIELAEISAVEIRRLGGDGS